MHLPPAPFRAAVSLMALCLLGGTGVVSAQEVVRGRLVAEEGGGPLAGAYVELREAGDTMVAQATLTRPDGWFELQAPGPGRYVVRADHLGYRPVELMVSARAGETLWVELSTGEEAIELEGLVAEVDRSCNLDPEAGARVVELWDEVAEAFRTAALAEDQGLYRLRVERWRRRLDPESRRVREELERREGFGNQRSSPFESLPPEELEADGYIQGDDRAGYRYLAPDARVLLSSSFQRTHCFGIEEDAPTDVPETAEGAWVGIRFEPREDDRPDIRGVLWIDATRLDPVRLDFRYTDLPWPVDHEDLGGRVGFRRLPEGPWVVSDWRIRMPVIRGEEVRAYPSAPLRMRHEIMALTEVGGRVTEVRSGEVALSGFAGTGGLEGAVTTASGAPASGARVQLTGTFFEVLADEGGRFGWTDVPAGRYTVEAFSQLADSVGVGEGTRSGVEVRPGGTASVTLVVPPAAEILARSCTQPLTDGGRGLLRGRVVAADGIAPPTADQLQVELSWNESVELREMGSALQVDVARARATVPVDPEGGWSACGLPTDEAVEVAVVLDGRSVGETGYARLREGALEEVDVRLPEGALMQAQAEVEDAMELPGLTVEVRRQVDRDLMDVGVQRAQLGRRFVGPDDLAEHRVGASHVGQLIERQHIPGVRIRWNEDIACVYSGRYTESDENAGGAMVQLCARLVLDGIPVHASVLRMLQPEQVAAMAFLRSSEAGARWGTRTGGGILFIWTKGSGVAPPP